MDIAKRQILAFESIGCDERLGRTGSCPIWPARSMEVDVWIEKMYYPVALTEESEYMMRTLS
jgi:hypothetical protein